MSRICLFLQVLLFNILAFGQVNVTHIEGSATFKKIGADSNGTFTCLVHSQAKELIVNKTDTVTLADSIHKFSIFKLDHDGNLVRSFNVLDPKPFVGITCLPSAVNTLHVDANGDIFLSGVIRDSAVTLLDTIVSGSICNTKVFACRIDSMGNRKWLRISDPMPSTRWLEVIDADLSNNDLKIYGTCNVDQVVAFRFGSDTVVPNKGIQWGYYEEWIVSFAQSGAFRFAHLPFDEAQQTLPLGWTGMIATDADDDSTIVLQQTNAITDYYALSVGDSTHSFSIVNTGTGQWQQIMLEHAAGKFHIAYPGPAQIDVTFHEYAGGAVNTYAIQDPDLSVPGKMAAVNQRGEKVLAANSNTDCFLYYVNRSNNIQWKHHILSILNGNGTTALEDVQHTNSLAVFSISPYPNGIVVDSVIYNNVSTTDGYLIIIDSAKLVGQDPRSELISMQTVTLFPNPSSGSSIMKWNKMYQQCSVQVYNLLGEKVWERTEHRTDHLRLDLNLQTGVYLVHVFLDNSHVTKKLIINRELR